MQSSNKKTSMLVKKSKNYHRMEGLAFKKFGIAKSRPQEQFPDVYLHVRKLNYGLLDTELETNQIHFPEPLSSAIQANKNCLRLYPPGCKALFVDTHETFEVMIAELKGQIEIAVDLEMHLRYSFRGTTALIQISSPTVDYLVCPFATRNEILTKLAPILNDPAIIKIFHAIDNDYLALRRDFGIILRGAVDTKEAYKLLTGEQNAIGFDNLLKYLHLHCQLDGKAEKPIAQKADWRLRPLPQPLLLYARHDSHALLRAWNLLKLKFLQKDKDIREAFTLTSALLSKLRYTPPKQEDALKGYASLLLPQDKNTKKRFIDMHRWRLNLSKMVDCSPSYILSNKGIGEIIASKPRDANEMQMELNKRFPDFLQGYQGAAFYRVFSEGFLSVTSKCHNCFLMSHQAWACWKRKDKSAWKRYMKDPVNKESRDRQYKRRMRKWMESRERRCNQ